jgi:Bacterial proteasome activator
MGTPSTATSEDGSSGPDAAAPAAPPVAGGELVAPAKAMRLLGALTDGLDELRRVNLDDAARGRVITTHRAALIEVASTVSDALIDEMVALRFEPLDGGATIDKIKVAQAQVVGWVNGLILAEATMGTPAVLGLNSFAPVSAPGVEVSSPCDPTPS